MPWSDQNIIKWIIGLIITGGSWLWIHVTWKNHINLQKHQLWVANNYPKKNEVKELISAHTDPIKQDVQEQHVKLDKITEYLYEIHRERHEQKRKDREGD